MKTPVGNFLNCQPQLDRNSCLNSMDGCAVISRPQSGDRSRGAYGLQRGHRANVNLSDSARPGPHTPRPSAYAPATSSTCDRLGADCTSVDCRRSPDVWPSRTSTHTARMGRSGACHERGPDSSSAQRGHELGLRAQGGRTGQHGATAIARMHALSGA